ncbi:MAG TPA: DUF5818 domain-containing protein [Candidatus Acidoferrales bacterium]|nr:DUF5818 domain-containing protein [Candidatus Acidoferrales bacterium]
MTVTRKKLMLAPVALVCGAMMFAIGYSFRPSRVSAQQTPAQAAHKQPIARSSVERHVGTILSKNGALLILADENNNAWYQLDDQGRASKFLGKKVVVFGRLDASTDVIHVWNIREIKT